MASKVTSKGQVTIPKEMRDRLGLKEGDTVKWFIHPNGNVVMMPTISITALRGILKYDGPPVTLEDMERGIIEGATGRHRLDQPSKRKAA